MIEWNYIPKKYLLVGNLDRLQDLLSVEDIEKLKKINKNFTNFLPSDSSLNIQNDDVSLAFGRSSVSHFDYILIEKYKIFSEFKIAKLNRINIFAGLNNTGKTTVLEALRFGLDTIKSNKTCNFSEYDFHRTNECNSLLLCKILLS